MRKKLCSLVLAVCLCLGLSVPALGAGAAFSDVPEGHWAYSFVEKAAFEGWVAGVGDGLFGVDNQVTYAEFSVMLTRAYFNDELEAYDGPADAWYTSYGNVAQEAGILEHTDAKNMIGDAVTMNRPVSRFDMAQMAYNVLLSESIELDFDTETVLAGIPDQDSIMTVDREAVAGVFTAGIIGGEDISGTFDGVSFMTRGQAAVVMCRLDEVVNGGGVTQPEEPDPTPDPEPAAGTLKNGKEATPENVIEMLKEIEEQYPTGMDWDNPEENPNTNGNPNPASGTMLQVMEGKYHTSTKYACGGFAAMVSDMIFPAEMDLREVTDFSQVRPGDIVFNINGNGQATHVWIALSESVPNSESIPWRTNGIADGNAADKVRWDWNFGGALMPKEEASEGRSYQVVYTRYPD